MASIPVWLLFALGVLLLVALAVVVVLYEGRQRRLEFDRLPLELRSLAPEQFESRLMRGFEQLGYRVIGSDGRLMALRRNGEITLVWYGDWKLRRSFRAQIRQVQKLKKALGEAHAAGGKIISVFPETERFIYALRGTSISIIDLDELEALIGSAGHTVSIQVVTSYVPPAPPPTHEEKALAAPVRVIDTSKPPSCPRCKSPMVLRTAESGSALGKHFWACSRAPECRGIRSAE